MVNFVLLQIDITDECPLYCSHCSNSSGPNLTRAIPYSDLSSLLEEASALGIRRLVLSGGEPLRHPDLARILEKGRILGFDSTVFTTGIQNKRTRETISISDWNRLAEAGLDRAIFSVYASPSNRAFHNSVVQLKPAGIIDAFEVNELGMQNAQHAGLRTEVQFIPSELTSLDLREIFEWGTNLGCERLHLQYPTEQGRNRISKTLSLSYTAEQALRSEAISLMKVAGQRFHISRLWRTRWEIEKVSDCDLQLIVRSDGAVVPCNACKYLAPPLPLKSIYEESLEKISGGWHTSCTCTKDNEEPSKQVGAAAGCSSLHIV